MGLEYSRSRVLFFFDNIMCIVVLKEILNVYLVFNFVEEV